jgi:hypothetical protein
MLIEGTFIYWPEQCQYCSKSWTTEHCARNQSFMRKLNGMYQEYLGSLEFKCDYFTPDLDKIKEKQQSECCCCGCKEC